MSSLDDIADVTITTATVFPTKLGFGIPLLLAYHTVTPGRVDSYTSTKGLTDAGFPVTHPVYLAAQRAFSQPARPKRIVIGRRALAYTKTVRLIPVATAAGSYYLFIVTGPNGVDTTIEYTVPGGGQTVAQIVTALRALIDPIGDVAAADDTTHVTVTSAAGTLFDLKDLPALSIMKVRDMTADPGIATDYAAVKAVDSKTWYAVTIDSNSEAEIAALAATVEADRKLFLAQSSDSDVADAAVTTDVASDLKAAAYKRTALVYDQRRLNSYLALGWAANRLVFRPGSTTWEYVTVSGPKTSLLTDTQEQAVKGKNAARYVELGGLNVVLGSVRADGDYIDNKILEDKTHAGIQSRFLGLVKTLTDSGKKLPYTDKGVDMVRGQVVLAEIADGIDAGGYKSDPKPTCTAPKVADIDPADRASRHLPDIEFSAVFTGAIHTVKMTGVLSV